MIADPHDFSNFSHSEKLMPQEEMLEIKKKSSSLSIGIPKETAQFENRICLVPEAVALLVQNRHRVLIESHAGDAAHFCDTDYSEAGGEIVTADEVFKADIVLKIAPLSAEEITKLKTRQILISSIQLTNQNAQYFKALMGKKATAIAFEKVKDKAGAYPVIRSMSKIVGNTAIIIAAEYLSSPQYGNGSMLGGSPGIIPTEVLILGAGTVAQNAARTAIGMGATVKVFDNSVFKLERLQNKLNNRIFTSIIQPKTLLKELKSADVVIGAIHSSDNLSPCIITEDMVRQMKEGSVIIDISIDQGGCIETSRLTNHKDPVFQVHGVSHYCVPNIASKVPHTASFALSNFFAPIILNIGEVGGLENYIRRDYGFCRGVYLFNGIITNKQVGELFNLPFQDIDLLMAAFR